MYLISPGGIIRMVSTRDSETGSANNKEEVAPMSSEDYNKALARRFLKAFANADLGTLDELLAPEFINHNPLPGQDPGREGYMRTVAEKHDASSVIRHTIEYQTTDGDMVITRHTTHRILDRGAAV